MLARKPYVVALFDRMRRWPFGLWLFSRIICFKAPYFGSISPLITQLESGLCEASMKHRRKVTNHIGTVHAIALCNLAELCAGMCTEASVPKGMRWIPKSMQVEYLKKAEGTMQARARFAEALRFSTTPYEAISLVSVSNHLNEEVFRARVHMWISSKPEA